MKFITNKEKGNCGLAFAIAYYTTQGYTVSIPLNDTQDYDLVVDREGHLEKIQVKATSQRADSGYTTVSLKSCGGTKGSTYKTVKDTDIDYVFVLTELQEMYEIPQSEITMTSCISLGPERQKYRVDNVDTVYEYKQRTVENCEKKHCSICGVEVSDSNTSGLCFACAMKNRQTTDRPSPEVLAQEILETSFVAVGRKYGVSDNAVRKWCRTYNIPTKKDEIKEWLSNR